MRISRHLGLFRRRVGKPVYGGKATALSAPRAVLMGESPGAYAIFAGGSDPSGIGSSVVDAYNASLTRSTLVMLYSSSIFGASASLNGYAIFGGGLLNAASEIPHSQVSAYGPDLTRRVLADLTESVFLHAGAATDRYAFFAGGATRSGRSSTVNVYNTALSKVSMSNTGFTAREQVMGSRHGDGSVLFFGGTNGTSPTSTLYFTTQINDSLVLSHCTWGPPAAYLTRFGRSLYFEKKALFAGGFSVPGDVERQTVIVFDGSTATTPLLLSVPRAYLASAVLSDGQASYALFAGGDTQSDPVDIVDVLDGGLSRVAVLHLSAPKHHLAGASVGSYALFAGGYINHEPADAVDIFKLD